jgi:hypothetical protein
LKELLPTKIVFSIFSPVPSIIIEEASKMYNSKSRITRRCMLFWMLNGFLRLANKEMVGARGFEPPASWSRTRRATRLRYAPREVKLTPLYLVVKGDFK